MDEYIAAAHANQAWLALREQKPEEARIQAEKALRIWSSLPLVSPFQSLAVWPLISVLQDQKDVPEVMECLNLLLHPSQHRLSDELTAAIQNTIQLGEKEDWSAFHQELKRTVEQARIEKHL
jgi:eukaryotic-like serine/threonine-protein kinase